MKDYDIAFQCGNCGCVWDYKVVYGRLVPLQGVECPECGCWTGHPLGWRSPSRSRYRCQVPAPPRQRGSE